MLYEGKAKQVFRADNEDQVIIRFKDNATAFNGIKKRTIDGKGALNNAITAIIFEMLHTHGVQTHFIKQLNEHEQLCKKVDIIPLEVIVRNVVAGSMAKRLGIAEGSRPTQPIYELCYKNDDLNDPLINEEHALALGVATVSELAKLKQIALEINEYLTAFFNKFGIELIDYKVEFGRLPDGEIVLADEFSPDNCRIWDKETGKKLDKDRFRRDMGSVLEAYEEVLDRISK